MTEEQKKMAKELLWDTFMLSTEKDALPFMQAMIIILREDTIFEAMQKYAKWHTEQKMLECLGKSSWQRETGDKNWEKVSLEEFVKFYAGKEDIVQRKVMLDDMRYLIKSLLPSDEVIEEKALFSSGGLKPWHEGCIYGINWLRSRILDAIKSNK